MAPCGVADFWISIVPGRMRLCTVHVAYWLGPTVTMGIPVVLVRVLWRSSLRVGVLTVQAASTNSNPGFAVSVSVTVLVALLLVGFHWNVAVPSFVGDLRARAGHRRRRRLQPAVGPGAHRHRRRELPPLIGVVEAVALVDELGDGHGRLAELEGDLAQRRRELGEVLHEREVGLAERGGRVLVEARDRGQPARARRLGHRRPDAEREHVRALRLN